jgi:hypothetical protein
MELVKTPQKVTLFLYVPLNAPKRGFQGFGCIKNGGKMIKKGKKMTTEWTFSAFHRNRTQLFPERA